MRTKLLIRLLLISAACLGLALTHAAELPTTQPVVPDGTSAKVLNQRLDRRLAEVRWNDVPFSKALDELNEPNRLNLYVNWRALEAAGVTRETPIKVGPLFDVSVRTALRLALAAAAGGAVRLSYDIQEDVIVISTAEDIGKLTVTLAYDVSDLNVLPPPAPASRPAQSPSTSPSAGGAIFGRDSALSNVRVVLGDEPPGGGMTRQEYLDALIRLIEEMLAPDTWRENGGSYGAVRELGGLLIVTQTPENQKQVETLLNNIRAIRKARLAGKPISLHGVDLSKPLGESGEGR